MYKELVKEFVIKERDSVNLLLENIENQYDDVINAILKCEGKVIFFGIGKSGHIGEKLAATYSSIGIPSFFVHAAEARHGDFGMIESRDLVVVLSHSGTTKETVDAMTGLKGIGCKTVAFCRSEASDLAKLCDLKLIYPFKEEADRLGLAPSSSTTVELVLGDAIGLAVSSLKGFSKEDFYKYHPGGSLGKLLQSEKK
jgi:KpsF/GutQ family protein